MLDRAGGVNHLAVLMSNLVDGFQLFPDLDNFLLRCGDVPHLLGHVGRL